MSTTSTHQPNSINSDTQAPAGRARRIGLRAVLLLLAAAVLMGPLQATVSACDDCLPQAPAAMAEPTDAFLNAEQTNDAATYTLSATTLRFKAGSFSLFRFDAATGQLLKKRTVLFANAVRFRAAHSLTRFGDIAYAKLTSGTYSGWYARAAAAGGSSVTTFAEPRQVSLAAGTHAGLRFYDSTRIVLRRAATLDAAATYTATRQATFNKRTFLYLNSGPLAGRWLATSSAVTLVSQQTSDAKVSSGPPATWKSIVLIYRETDVTFTRSDGSSYRLRARMSDTMYDLSRKMVGRFVNSVSTWSAGYAAIDMTIVDVPGALTNIEQLSGGKYWVGPRSVKTAMDKYAPSGAYDSIFVLYEAKDSAGVRIPTGGWGLTLPPGSWANGAGFTSIHTPAEMWWWTGTVNPEEVFVHEWLHQVLFFHGDAGRLSLDLHANAQYGYSAVDGSYKAWYSDVMRGLVRDGSSYTGVSYDMWRAGTPTLAQGW